MVELLFEVCLNMIRSQCLILICVEAFTEVVNISTNSIKDADDTYFPTVKEPVSSIRKGGLPEQGSSKKPAQQTVDELAIEKSSHFSNLNKSTLGVDIDSSQRRHT
jgi:hypothetical protein